MVPSEVLNSPSSPLQFYLQVRTELAALIPVLQWFESHGSSFLPDSVLWQCKVEKSVNGAKDIIKRGGGHEDTISRVRLQTSSLPTTITSPRQSEQSEQSPNQAETNVHNKYGEQKETHVALLFGRRFYMVSLHGQVKLSSSRIG